MQSQRHLAWDIYEEHLDEAAFLWTQWERSLSASNYCIAEVAEGPEARLRAHLDALVIGDVAVAERLLLPALAADDRGRVAASAWALWEAEDADHFETLWNQLTMVSTAPQRSAIFRALELSPRTDASASRLMGKFRGAPPELAAGLIDAVAARGAAALSRLPLCELDVVGFPDTQAALLRAIQSLQDPSFTDRIESGLTSEHADAREAALEAGTLFKVASTRDCCRRSMTRGESDSPLAMALLSLAGDGSDHTHLIDSMKDPRLAHAAIWALGFSGRADVAQRLLELLDDAALAPLAAESFATITGMVLTGALLQTTQPAEADLGEAEPPLDDDAPVPRLEAADDLAVPSPVAVRGWWQRHRSRFDSNQRYWFGATQSDQALGLALQRAPTWRRQALRLAARPAVASGLRLRGWAQTQCQQTAEAR